MKGTRIGVDFLKTSTFISRKLYSLLVGKEISTLAKGRISKADQKNFVEVELFAREIGSDSIPEKIGESKLFKV